MPRSHRAQRPTAGSQGPSPVRLRTPANPCSGRMSGAFNFEMRG